MPDSDHGDGQSYARLLTTGTAKIDVAIGFAAGRRPQVKDAFGRAGEGDQVLAPLCGFTLRPEPTMLRPTVSGDTVTVRFKGFPGATHRV